MLVLRPEKLLSTGEAVAVQAIAEIASGLEVGEAGCFQVR
jgi:hypothetical protein